MLSPGTKRISLRADRLPKKVIAQCEAADVVAKARAAESIGDTLSEPLALAMGRFSVNQAERVRIPSVQPFHALVI